jgi:hypothetical protein
VRLRVYTVPVKHTLPTSVVSGIPLHFTICRCRRLRTAHGVHRRVYHLIRRHTFSIMLLLLTILYGILRHMVIPFPPWSYTVAQFALPIQLYTYAVGIFLYWLTRTFRSFRGIRNTPWMIFFTGGCGIILSQGIVPTVCSLFLLSLIAKHGQS